MILLSPRGMARRWSKSLLEAIDGMLSHRIKSVRKAKQVEEGLPEVEFRTESSVTQFADPDMFVALYALPTMEVTRSW